MGLSWYISCGPLWVENGVRIVKEEIVDTKVFCKDCKHYNLRREFGETRITKFIECHAPQNKQDTYLEPEFELIDTPVYINAGNTCGWFEPIPKPQVFCINCQFVGGGVKCKHPNNQIKDYYSGRDVLKREMASLNSDCMCEWYEESKPVTTTIVVSKHVSWRKRLFSLRDGMCL